MKLDVSMKRVANLLKTIINQQCESDFVWYKDIGEMPTMMDINFAIRKLEETEDINMTVMENEE